MVWLFVRLVGAFVPGCPRDLAASFRSESSTRYPRVLWAVLPPGLSVRCNRAVVGPRCSPQYLGRINLLGLRIGGLALLFVGPSCAGGVFGLHSGAGVSRGRWGAI